MYYTSWIAHETLFEEARVSLMAVWIFIYIHSFTCANTSSDWSDNTSRKYLLLDTFDSTFVIWSFSNSCVNVTKLFKFLLSTGWAKSFFPSIFFFCFFNKTSQYKKKVISLILN